MILNFGTSCSNLDVGALTFRSPSRYGVRHGSISLICEKLAGSDLLLQSLTRNLETLWACRLMLFNLVLLRLRTLRVLRPSTFV